MGNEKKLVFIEVLLFSLVFLLIAKAWFSPGTLSAGDWPYLYKENIKDFSYFPTLKYLWLSPYYQIGTKFFVEQLHIPWESIERIFWFFPVLIVSWVGSRILTKSWIGALIYSTNTYMLMIVGGGQMGVALAYSFAPFVFHSLISPFKDRRLLFLYITVVLSLQMVFDPRITLCTLLGVCLYSFRSIKIITELMKKMFFPMMTAMLFHLYWIYPMFIKRSLISTFIPDTTLDTVKFLSFAGLSQTISLLHPNWPENYFGKVYFMRPEFIILPLIVFVGFFWVKKENASTKTHVTTLGLVGLIGAFLSKGANPPFGALYLFLFDHVPGGFLFRDATKFYVITALSYSILIPYAMHVLQKKIRVRFSILPEVLFVSLWLILIRQALTGGVAGAFQPVIVPEEYIQFKNMILHDSRGVSSLWIPQVQRFGFNSVDHPAYTLHDLDTNLTNFNTMISKSSQMQLQAILRKRSVGYVVVPFDVRKEIYLTDYRYDDVVRQRYINALSSIPFLIRVGRYNNLTIYKVERM